MKFKVYTISLILLLLLAVSNLTLGINHNNHDIGGLLDVAYSTQGDILGYSINGHIKMVSISTKELSTLAKALGYNEILTQENEYTFDGHKYTVLDWHSDNTYYKINVNFQGNTNYVSVSVDMGSDSNPIATYDKVKETLEAFNSDVHITTSIYMELDEELTLVEVVEKVYTGFNMLSADLVGDYENDNGSFGFLGYSPYLKNSIEIEGKKFNLHMAVNYNDYSGKYHLVIANPIIESSY